MKKILLSLTLALSIGISFACINEYTTLLSGDVVFGEHTEGRVWPKKIDTTSLASLSEELSAAYDSTGSIEAYSDYAAALVYLGEYQTAKKVYEEIESIQPNLYTTASNLGTIYELIGKPDSALIWIERAIALNPESHGGSEWIHIKILEFKLYKDADIQSSILGLDFGDSAIPSNPHQYDLQELERQIKHQLRERITLVKPKNQIVGNLCFDYGNIVAQTLNIESALESYALAQEYGFESELMTARIAAFKEMTGKAERLNLQENAKKYVSLNSDIILPIMGVGVVAFLVLFLLLIRRRINKSREKRTA
ncbi:MAG: tetratricopeptide repeat protein [Flavobacteriia bacterium]|nr:tetratricopeptide repeat protein [Flavobacteriia bacterium]